MNCWEFMKCPDKTFQTCPAYPDKGLDCWKVTGTRCAQGKFVKATNKEKVEHCRSCAFYEAHAHKY